MEIKMPKVKPKLSKCQVDLLKTLLDYGMLTVKQLATKAKRDFTGTQWDVGRVCDRGKGKRTLETFGYVNNRFKDVNGRDVLFITLTESGKERAIELNNS
jgi:hypothetical protein